MLEKVIGSTMAKVRRPRFFTRNANGTVEASHGADDASAAPDSANFLRTSSPTLSALRRQIRGATQPICPVFIPDVLRQTRPVMNTPTPTVSGNTKLALSREEAAHAIGVSAITVDRLTKRGLLRPSRATRRPLYPVWEIERFLRETCVEIDKNQ